jgi:acyl-CoA oxidase
LFHTSSLIDDGCDLTLDLGTERHYDAIIRGANFEELGCFCLTELGHGSDVSKLETTVHYDQLTNEFIIHSPTKTSRKFWIGNLAVTATKAVVFGQLIISGK